MKTKHAGELIRTNNKGEIKMTEEIRMYNDFKTNSVRFLINKKIKGSIPMGDHPRRAFWHIAREIGRLHNLSSDAGKWHEGFYVSKDNGFVSIFRPLAPRSMFHYAFLYCPRV